MTGEGKTKKITKRLGEHIRVGGRKGKDRREKQDRSEPVTG